MKHTPRRFTYVVVALATLTACATPVGVARENPKMLYRSLTRSALSDDRPSAFTEQLLRRRGLEERYEQEPEKLLDELHRTQTSHDRDHDRLFALAELYFLHGGRTQKRECYLAAALYAYAFLARGERRETVAPQADPRVPLAADLYNVALTLGLTVTHPTDDGILANRTLSLPFGELELRHDPEQFRWGSYRLTRFIPLIEYKVRGLRNRYRQPGIGVPLAAELAPMGSGARVEAASKRVPPTLKVPVTAFVRFDNVLEAVAAGHVRGTIEVHAADEATTVEVAGLTLPLELDTSASLAYMLEGTPVWDTGIPGFLRGDRAIFGDGLVMLHPYRAGRIPVVLVHGTASRPASWADIINEVQNDPSLRTRFQLWLFTYNSSNPILASAGRLRDALRSVVRDLDPDDRDAALQRMVVMGHSQGGLLTRLMVTDSGTRFWDNVSPVAFDEVKLPPATRDTLRRAMFFERSPLVSRVVFMATPHHGSFRMTGFVLGIMRRLVTLPLTLAKDFAQIGALKMLTALDNMRPGDPFVRSLSASPLAPGVTAHSIVAVEGSGDFLDRNDGLVAYRSAHLDGVASEKIVRSSHSMQSNPDTILEVRRILREHLDAQRQ
jgi:pimeloyl-ACP methyl ester carboxylesterase